MSDLKLYVYDHGWDGAELIWAKDEAEAKDYIADLYLPIYESRVAEHEKWHGKNGLKEYRENIWIKDVEYYKNREFHVDLVEVEPGIAYQTTGEQ